MLEVSTLCCLRGEREVFRDVTFSVGSGQWVHVRGENGAGKTTLLRALTGLLRPTAGTIAWNGQTLHALGEEYHRSILYLGHANGIKDDLDAQENLRAVQAIADSSSEVQVTDAMRALGLDPANTTPIRALSQGQKRRVALARLALGDARLWILDEPFAALDTGAISSVLALMDRHLKKGGALVLTRHQTVALTQPGTEVWIGPSNGALNDSMNGALNSSLNGALNNSLIGKTA